MKYSLSIRLTRGEAVAGFLYLPFFYVITSLIVSFVLELIGRGSDLVLTNLVFNYVNFGFVVIVFHKFLANSLYSFGRNIWKSLQSVILSISFWLVLTVLLSFVLGAVFGDFSNPNDDLVLQIAGMSRNILIICACILAPIVEEALFRGVVFGMIHRKNRYAAYIISFLLFGAVHVWQFAVSEPSWFLLVNLLEYLPASIALAWAYEKGDNIFCPIVLHAAINCVSVFQLF